MTTVEHRTLSEGSEDTRRLCDSAAKELHRQVDEGLERLHAKILSDFWSWVVEARGMDHEVLANVIVAALALIESNRQRTHTETHAAIDRLLDERQEAEAEVWLLKAQGKKTQTALGASKSQRPGWSDVGEARR